MDKIALDDVWSKLIKPKCDYHYTWEDKNTKSRIDYWLVSKKCTCDLYSIKSKIVITDKIGKRLTDHKALILNIKVGIPKRGPGYWKLNTSLLYDETYCNDIVDIIQHLKTDACLKGVNDSTKWDILKLRIKECSIKHSIRLSRQRRGELELLEHELELLEKENTNDDNIFRMEEIKHRLHELYTDISEGAKIRAKVNSVNEVETNAQLFKNIEQSRQHKNVITCLKDSNGKEVNDQMDILSMIGKFYESLYQSKNIDINDIETLLDTVKFENILSEEQKLYLDRKPSLEEFDEIVNLPKEKKSPGLDGLPIEFYRKFWHEIRILYFEMIEDASQHGLLPISTRTSVLSTLHKADCRKQLANYRPLSLTNTDYKLITFLFANRLNDIISNIINPDQVAYIKDRYIGTSIRNIIDLYEYCENNDISGAFLCTDFEKAFDSLEHNFIRKTLQKFNFGQNFIKWFDILYNDARFKIKNNGWISKHFLMKRGLRQGCALSALIFIINVEVLATLIRQNNNITGITVDDKQHKVIQYADDMTVCVSDFSSICNVLETLEIFGKFSGLKLNVKKSKGIWLGPLKEHGIRVYKNITFTGNPVKCLGIYVGHNSEKCLELNWKAKLNKIENLLHQWSKRNLSLFGKIEVIKTYILSKIVFNATVLEVPTDIVHQLKTLLHYFLWGKRDRVKRKNIIRHRNEGGLSMVDIDSFLLSLKASWISRLRTTNGKWADIFYWYVKSTHLPQDYIWKLSCRKIDQFPILTKLPQFYQNVILAFNMCKSIKPFDLLNTHEVVQQPIWGNEYFKVNDSCVYIKGWVKSKVLYIKDLISDSGEIKSDKEFFECNVEKQSCLHSMFILKNYVIKKIRDYDLSIAPFVKIRYMNNILVKNEWLEINRIKSKVYYNILSNKIASRGNMESVYAREFNFKNDLEIWRCIYKQKLFMSMPKLNEFNYKLLHNIVPCGTVVSKWKQNVSNLCDYCKQPETTKHMIYDCSRVKSIWNFVSLNLGFDIKWKHLVCGFVLYDKTPKIEMINYIITIICYAIFKESCYCKYNSIEYKNSDLKICIKQNLIYYKKILQHVNPNMCKFIVFDKLYDSM